MAYNSLALLVFFFLTTCGCSFHLLKQIWWNYTHGLQKLGFDCSGVQRDLQFHCRSLSICFFICKMQTIIPSKIVLRFKWVGLCKMPSMGPGTLNLEKILIFQLCFHLLPFISVSVKICAFTTCHALRIKLIWLPCSQKSKEDRDVAFKELTTWGDKEWMFKHQTVL